MPHHYLIELYTPNAAWLALPAEARQRFLDGIRAGMGALSALGIEALALGPAEPGLRQASPHRFLGIWRCPDRPARDALLAGIEASGWYGYFDHVNAAADAGSLPGHLSELATVAAH